jgi:hypothetical protein
MASSSCCRKRPPRRAHSWNRTGTRGRAIPAWSLLWTTQTTGCYRPSSPRHSKPLYVTASIYLLTDRPRGHRHFGEAPGQLAPRNRNATGLAAGSEPQPPPLLELVPRSMVFLLNLKCRHRPRSIRYSPHFRSWKRANSRTPRKRLSVRVWAGRDCEFGGSIRRRTEQARGTP